MRAGTVLSRDAGQKPWKLVLVARTYLKMNKGKMAALCCHATLGVMDSLRAEGAEDELDQWSGRAKIVAKCPSEEELLALQVTAREAGLPTYLVRDAGTFNSMMVVYAHTQHTWWWLGGG